MKAGRLVIWIAAFSVASSAAFGATGKPDASYALSYEGGSAGFKPHRTVRVVVTGNQVVFVQDGRQVSVPVENISAISCATNVRRRTGAAVLGRIPLVDLDKAQTHYVGITLADDSVAGANRSGELVFKLTRDEFRSFLPNLERLTGKQAVDTGKTPTVVRYRD